MVAPKRPSVAARQSSQLIAHGFTLANRGALFAARSEFLQALSLIAEERDARNGNNECAEALAAAWQALTEADEFLPKNSRGVFNRDIEQLVGMHRTPVLQGKDLTGVNAIVALQHYYTYARNQLARAVHGEAEASKALFALGKMHMQFPQQAPGERRRNGQKAVAFHQAALMVDERNHLAANELGVLLARASQHEFAKEVFLRSLMTRQRVETWHNLAAVHKALGEVEEERRALMQKQRLVALQTRRQTQGSQANRGGVEWVSPAEFVRSNPEQPQLPANTLPAADVSGNRSRLPTASTRIPRSVGLSRGRSAKQPAPWTRR